MWDQDGYEPMCQFRGMMRGYVTSGYGGKFAVQRKGIKYRRRIAARLLLLLSPLGVGVLASAREAGGDDDAVEEGAGNPHAHQLSYMSSCPFSDLVVVLLVVVVLHHVLTCSRRSMHLRFHGWNKSSSMLRDGFGVKYSGFLHIRPCDFCRGD